MTDTLARRATGPAGASSEVLVRESRDWREIERHLADDRPFAAYALGHLEWGLFEWARFWIAEGPDGVAVVMHALALGATTVTVGAPSGVEAIASLHHGPRRSYLSTTAPEHIPALRRAYHVTDTLSMVRMSVTPASFRAVHGEVRRMRGRDAWKVNALYGSEGGPTHYSPESIERAIYYGIFDGDRLASVAGTHIVAPNQGIAIVGNVFTDAAYRGQGLATRVTSAVTEELIERGCAEVALTVDPVNTPALAAYSRLGYRRGSPVVEARLQRRDLLGIGPALRRRRARGRGARYGANVEVVDAWGTGPRDGQGARPHDTDPGEDNA
ncbi:MAG: GNAT family N-acetyltransferase [Dehalococcoidia bacterium]|nr:GNAT family N-acetyltransferase [Dehalococcoidia bacterium]